MNKTLNPGQIHGTDPQNLMEKIVRSRIHQTRYWNEQCAGLSAETLVDKAVGLEEIGGSYGGNRKASPFLCLTLKMLQLNPEKEIIIEFIKNPDYRYLRCLGAFYLRLTGNAKDIYEYLEAFYSDYRAIRWRLHDGKLKLSHVDSFMESLLHEERVCDVILPHINPRRLLEETGAMEPRVSILEEELESSSDESEDESSSESEKKSSRRTRTRSPVHRGSRSRSRERHRSRSPRRLHSRHRRSSPRRSGSSHRSPSPRRLHDRSSSYRRSRSPTRRRRSHSPRRRSPGRYRRDYRERDERGHRDRDRDRDRSRSRRDQVRRRHDDRDRYPDRGQTYERGGRRDRDISPAPKKRTWKGKKSKHSSKRGAGEAVESGESTGGGLHDMNNEEMNKMRKKLGLKPLE